MNDARAGHWDDRYRTVGSRSVSWFADEPTTSLRLLRAAGLGVTSSVIDVGGGASHLVDRLLDAGTTDVTVVDVSQVALDEAAARVGADRAAWVCTDLLDWTPDRQWDLWHDRAVLHFLTTPAEVATYRRLVGRAVADGGHAVVGGFATDGPTTCSGLHVARRSPDEVAAVFGPTFEVVEHHREVHRTPSGAEQPFTWVVLRRAGAA